MSFAVIGDYGAGGQEESDVANLVKSWSPELILTLGDNNYEYGWASTIDAHIGQFYHDYIGNYQGSYGSGSPGHNRFFPVLGDHDWGDTSPNPTGADPYLDYFTLPGTPEANSGFTLPSPNPNTNERYYSFIQGPVQFFALSTDKNEPDGNTANSIQAMWLKNALAASNSPWKIVYLHNSPYSSGEVHGPNHWMQWPFAEWGASAVLGGNEHTYERLKINGLSYFVNGLGGDEKYGFSTPLPGSQVRFGDDFGAMKVDASDTAMTFKFITRAGLVVDSHTLFNTGTPASPSNVVATALANTQIKLTWQDNSLSESGYTVERSRDGGAFSTVAILPANSSSYLDQAEIYDGTTYSYRVKGTSSTWGDSTYSSTASVRTGSSRLQTLVTTEATWKYLDNGSDQGIAWRSSGFNDSSWKSGNGQFGYGDGDEGTYLNYGPYEHNKRVTSYFRSSFNVNSASSVTALNARLMRDDGAVVYLNGVEVFRSNMPEGTITSSTLALDSIYGSAESTYIPFTINPALLVSGQNTLAVEIHQEDPDSSDISFNFELTASTVSGISSYPTHLTATAVSASQVNLAWSDNSGSETGYKLERKTGGNGAWMQIASLAANTTTFSDAGLLDNTSYSYRVRASNPSADSSYSTAASVNTPSANSGSLFSSAQDIGSVGLAGGYSVANGIHTVRGAGSDIWGTSDSFRYVYRSLSGDGSITAHVKHVQFTDGWAKAGVMIRSSSAGNSAHAGVFVTPGNGVAFQYRNTTGGESSNANVTGMTSPYWIRLTRAGNTFKAESSPNGTNWSQVGSTIYIAMNSTILIGLAVTSGDAGVLNASVFDQVSISSPSVNFTTTSALGISPTFARLTDRVTFAELEELMEAGE